MPARRRTAHESACERLAFCQSVSWGLPLFSSLLLCFFRAFSEVDFTTEGAQHHGRRHCGPAHSTHEGTSLFDGEPGMRLGLERNIVVNFAADRLGPHVGRSR